MAEILAARARAQVDSLKSLDPLTQQKRIIEAQARFAEIEYFLSDKFGGEVADKISKEYEQVRTI